MGGSADPEAPTPTPSPSPSPSPSPAKATPSPASADGNRLRRCVQSKLSWGPPKAGGGGGEAGGAGLPPLAAGDGAPEKVKRRGRPRKSEAGKKVHCLNFAYLSCCLRLLGSPYCSDSPVGLNFGWSN